MKKNSYQQKAQFQTCQEKYLLKYWLIAEKYFQMFIKIRLFSIKSKIAKPSEKLLKLTPYLNPTFWFQTTYDRFHYCKSWKYLTLRVDLIKKAKLMRVTSTFLLINFLAKIWREVMKPISWMKLRVKSSFEKLQVFLCQN